MNVQIIPRFNGRSLGVVFSGMNLNSMFFNGMFVWSAEQLGTPCNACPQAPRPNPRAIFQRYCASSITPCSICTSQEYCGGCTCSSGSENCNDKGRQFSAAINVGSQENCDMGAVLLTAMTLLPTGVEHLSRNHLPEQACLISVEDLLWLILCENVGPLLFEPLLYVFHIGVHPFSRDHPPGNVVTGLETL